MRNNPRIMILTLVFNNAILLTELANSVNYRKKAGSYAKRQK